MRQCSVIADGDAEAADPGDGNGGGDDFPAGSRKKDETDQGQDVDRDDVVERRVLAGRGLPPGSFPRFGT